MVGTGWRVRKKCEVVVGTPRFIGKVQVYTGREGGLYVNGKAHVCSVPSRGSFPSVAFETVPAFTRAGDGTFSCLQGRPPSILFAVPLSCK